MSSSPEIVKGLAAARLIPRSPAGTVPKRSEAGPASLRGGHRIRLASPAERDQIADYLRLGGWLVERVGKRDLRADYQHGPRDGRERVNLRFSVAVWRGMGRWD